MPKIHRLKTMACQDNKSDKIYVVAIVEESGFYKLKTAHCGRGLKANSRTEDTSPYVSALLGKYNKIVRTRGSHGYVEVPNWRDNYYKPMRETVYEWGTPPDEPANGLTIVTETVAKPVSVQAQPAKKVTKKATVQPFDRFSIEDDRNI